MANLQRLITRRPHIDEAELESVRARTVERLAALSDAGKSAEPVDAAAAESTAPKPAPDMAKGDKGSRPAKAGKNAGPVAAGKTIALGPPAAMTDHGVDAPAVPARVDEVPATSVAGTPGIESASLTAAPPVTARPTVTPRAASTPIARRADRSDPIPVMAEPSAGIVTGGLWPSDWMKSIAPVERSVAAVETAPARPDPKTPLATRAAAAQAAAAQAAAAAAQAAAAAPVLNARTAEMATEGPAVIKRPAVIELAAPTGMGAKAATAEATVAGSAEAGPTEAEPAGATLDFPRRDPAEPAPRYAVISDDWDGQEPPAPGTPQIVPTPAVATDAPVASAGSEPDPAIAPIAPPEAAADVVATEPSRDAGRREAERQAGPATAATGSILKRVQTRLPAPTPGLEPPPIKSALAAPPVAAPQDPKPRARPAAPATGAAKMRVSTRATTPPASAKRKSATIPPPAAVAASKPRPAVVSVETSPVAPPPVVRRDPRPRLRPTAPATGAAKMRPQTRAMASPTASAAATFCPYCALSLDPPPTSSRRCVRCRQRIIVKRVQGRVVYLTEAAVDVFESERRRSVNFGRWSKERAQWLRLATSVHADAGRIDRLGEAPLSDKVVASARTLYLSTAERGFRDAKRDDRWEDASRLKRDQAAALYRLGGSPIPPPDDVLAMHREALAAELRGIGRMAKEARLVGSTCCEACRADDGRTFRIAAELRSARLPHDRCPKGLCRCRWDLALRDETMVRRYLKRAGRSPKAGSVGD